MEVITGLDCGLDCCSHCMVENVHEYTMHKLRTWTKVYHDFMVYTDSELTTPSGCSKQHTKEHQEYHFNKQFTIQWYMGLNHWCQVKMQ